MSSVLVRGISGQSGQIISKLLHGHGHKVLGLTHSSQIAPEKKKYFDSVYLWDGNCTSEIRKILLACRPDVVFNLAAAHTSSEKKTIDRDVLLSVNFTSLAILAEELYKAFPEAMLVNASSSHIYSPTKLSDVVSETTPPQPMNFYGCTKLLSMKLLDFYRTNNNFNTSNVILFNHESELRTEEFVTRKISMTAAKIKLGLEDKLVLRNIAANTDFSCAYDVMRALITIGLSKLSTDFIISSNTATSITDLVTRAFSELDLDWRAYVDSERNETTPFLIGDNSKLKAQANWQPNSDINSVIKRMVRHDYNVLKSSI